MPNFFIFYVEANIVCLVIFAIMLSHDLRSIDRQEKVIKYDWTLITFMAYFVGDIVWAGIISNALPKTATSVMGIAIVNCFLTGGITFAWMRYVLAVANAPLRNKTWFNVVTAIPLVALTLVLIFAYMVSPSSFIDSRLNLKPTYDLFQIILPDLYLILILIYTIVVALRRDDPRERRTLIYVGLFPLMMIIGGFVQAVFTPYTPIFCFASVILMVIFYIQAMEKQVSLDPLTGLNNRGRLRQYASQPSSIRREDRRTLVYMLDIDSFKQINDAHGHAEGDKALIILADSMKSAASGLGMPLFLARYGGDEFIAILHPEGAWDSSIFKETFRRELASQCEKARIDFDLTASVGCSELGAEPETFAQCLERADKELYEEKRILKGLVR